MNLRKLDFSNVFKVSKPASGEATVDAIVLKKQANPGTAEDGQLNYATDGNLYIYVTNAWVLVGEQASE